MKCTNCGAALDRAATFCGYCGSAVTSAAPATQAIEVAQPALAAAGMPSAPAFAPQAMSDLTPYYVDAFNKIEVGGVGASKWNWAAVFFTAFWYMYKGMWAKGLMMLGLNLSTGGVLWPLFWVYAGKVGNYDYWLLRTKGKQLW